MEKTTLQEKQLYEIIAAEGLLASTPWNVYWKNRNGIFLGCNNEQALFFGLKDSSEIVGKTNFDLVDYDTAVKVSEIDKKILDTGETQIIEESFGSQYFLSKKMPLKNSKGEIVGILGTSVDITKQKMLEQGLRKSTQELAGALETKQRFIRNLCHEIRTPMQPILSMPQCLKEHFYTMSDEHKLEFIDCAIDGATRLNNLLTNLLDISKFKEGKFVLEFKLENLKDLLAEVVQEFHLSHGNIKVSIDDDVQQEILSDKFRLHQVLRNLIANSIRYGSKAKPITISLSNCIENDIKYIKFSVKDDGVGIPKEERGGIFEPFIESTITRSNAGGTGLGLAIAKEIIESHLGRIWVDDTRDGEVGTKMSFTVPSHISRKQIAQAKHEKKKKVEIDSILLDLPGHVYWKDEDGVILGVNDIQANCLGFQNAQDLVGKTAFDLIDPESAQKVYENDLAVIQTGATLVVEERLVINRKEHIFITHKAPLRDAGGRIVGTLGVSIDITQQKEVECNLKQRVQELAAKLEKLQTEA